MDQFINIASNCILVKDMSNIIDFKTIDEEFDKLSFVENQYNHISTDLNFFDKDVFTETKASLIRECENYLGNSFRVTEFEHLKMTNSWGNITKPGEKHHEHQHPFSVVSGVIYLDDNPCNYNLQLEQFFPETPYFLYRKKFFSSLADLMPIPDPKNLQYHLVLFLSNTHHSVANTSTNDIDRRSIAFNTFWSGNVGSQNMLNSYKF